MLLDAPGADAGGGDARGADARGAEAPGADAGGGPARLAVREDSGDAVRVNVDAQTAGYLVLADAIQHDWVATVDGAAAPVVAADHAFGAVHVPAGRHTVTLRYEPAGWAAGQVITWVSLGALLLAAGAAAVSAARRRRRPWHRERL